MSVNFGLQRDGGYRVGLVLDLSADCNKSVGHCWMKGRLRDGDLAMAMQRSGDCFWDIELIERCGIFGGGDNKGKLAYKLIPGSRFGAYVCGTPHSFQPTAREMHLLMAGETTTLSDEAK